MIMIYTSSLKTEFSLLSFSFPLQLLCPGMGCDQYPFDSIISPDILPSEEKRRGILKAGHWTLTGPGWTRWTQWTRWTDRMGRIAHSKVGIIFFHLPQCPICPICLFVSSDICSGRICLFVRWPSVKSPSIVLLLREEKIQTLDIP